MTRLPLAMLALVVLATVPACGQGAPGQAARKPAALAQAREADGEAALVRAVALQAHAALQDVDAAYKALKLDTAAGRKLTPKREPVVREGLVPVIARLDATTAAIAAKLAPAEASPKLATLLAAFNARAPQATDAAPADVAATTLLYRVAQYRLKLGFLVEYALRRGLVAELPAPAPAPTAD